jgi:dihydrofolate reductase
MRKLKIYIAASLDGYIAKPNDDLSFLKAVEKDGEDYGYEAFISSIDTIILGRKTYDYVIRAVGSVPYESSKKVFVITRTKRESEGKVQFYNGNLKALIEGLKQEPGKDIFCDGGSEIIDELLKSDLVDELVISVIPILLGEGTRLFKGGRPEQLLAFRGAKTFETGLVQLHYIRAKG